MTICQHIAQFRGEVEVCLETVGAWTFVYTWQVDYGASNEPVGEDYTCALEVYRSECLNYNHALTHIDRCAGPVQAYTWEASTNFPHSNEPTPCERRDAMMKYIKAHPDNWVESVKMQEAL